jgi:hypothetical protein
MADLKKCETLLKETNEKLLSAVTAENVDYQFSEIIQPGDSLSIVVDQSGAAISWLSLFVKATDQAQALRSTILSATFDGTQTIWVPVGEFFGTGYQLNPHQTG